MFSLNDLKKKAKDNIKKVEYKKRNTLFDWILIRQLRDIYRNTNQIG